MLNDIGLKNSNSSKMMYVDVYYFNKIARKINDIEEDLKQEYFRKNNQYARS